MCCEVSPGGGGGATASPGKCVTVKTALRGGGNEDAMMERIESLEG